jgi:hypothetical protein
MKLNQKANNDKPHDRSCDQEQHAGHIITPNCIALIATISLNFICWLALAWLIASVTAMMP